MRDDNCIFCKIANGEIPSATLYEDEEFRVILDLGPASKGHALILPKNHYRNLYDIDEATASKAICLAKKMITKMTDVLGCDGYNIVQNNEEAAGQTVFHFHMHLIPRYKNDNVGLGWHMGELTEEDKKEILEKYGHPSIEAILESAQRSIGQFNEFGYDDLVISIKSSDVVTTYQANMRFAELYSYPLHLGVTEAGAMMSGIIRSSVGIGGLLLNGIGETIRVSLTGDPVQEIVAAKEILSACNLRNEGIRIVSCPTCGRCKTDILSIVTQIKEQTANIKTPLVVAVMGCGVNGPGEAREADLGVACGDGKGVLFKKGEIVATVAAEDIVQILLDEIADMVVQK